MTRAEFLRTAVPNLIAEVRMYATEDGGRKTPAIAGWGVPCMASLAHPLVGWDALLLIGDQPLRPGESRRMGFVFLTGEKGASVMRDAGRFFLWEGRAVGEAYVVD